MKTIDNNKHDDGSGTNLVDFASLLLSLGNGNKPKQVSPYLTAEQAADYLQITVKALYGLVERRKVRPLPGHRRYRFLPQQLDAYLRGEPPR